MTTYKVNKLEIGSFFLDDMGEGNCVYCQKHHTKTKINSISIQNEESRRFIMQTGICKRCMIRFCNTILNNINKIYEEGDKIDN